MNLLTLLSSFLLFTASPNWQSYKSTPQVDVDYRTEQCNDASNGIYREYIFLRMKNKTSQSVNVSWQFERYENNACSTCGKDEYKYSVTIAPNAEIIAQCGSNQRELMVFVKHLDLPNHKTFTKFELGNFTVTPL